MGFSDACGPYLGYRNGSYCLVYLSSSKMDYVVCLIPF